MNGNVKMVSYVLEQIKTRAIFLGLNIIRNRLFAKLQEGVQEGQTSSCAALADAGTMWLSNFKAGGNNAHFPILCIGLPLTNGFGPPSVPIYLNRPSWPPARTTGGSPPPAPMPVLGCLSKELPIPPSSREEKSPQAFPEDTLTKISWEG